VPVEAHHGRVVLQLASGAFEDRFDEMLYRLPGCSCAPWVTSASISRLAVFRSSRPSVRNTSRSPGASATGCTPQDPEHRPTRTLAGNRHRQRVHCTTVCGHQIVDQPGDLVSRPTDYVASWFRSQAHCCLGWCRGRSRSSGGCWGDVAAVIAVDGSPTAMRLLVPERARW
jgi:hypothetical protein